MHFALKVLSHHQRLHWQQKLSHQTWGSCQEVERGRVCSYNFMAKIMNIYVKVNPSLIYVCDPVMGDTGPGLYVPKWVYIHSNLCKIGRRHQMFHSSGSCSLCIRTQFCPWLTWPYPISLRQNYSQVQH